MRKFCFYAGLFLITASVLMVQVIQTRILSVITWYYMAFFTISIAMFGLTAGSVWVYMKRERFSERTLSYDLTHFSTAFAVTTALSLGVQMTLPLIFPETAITLVIWLELAICLAVPFFFAGVVVSLALTRSPYPVGLVYGVDLAGAAVGCLGVLLLLNLVDGPTAVLWISAIVALAAILFRGSGIGQAPTVALPFSQLVRRADLIFVLLLLCAVGNGLTRHGIQPISIKGVLESLHTPPSYVAWNSFSRIAVFDRDFDPRIETPLLWGPSPIFRPGEWSIQHRTVNIDGQAGTAAYRIDGDPAKAAFLRYDVTSLAHFLPGHRRAAVIGVGGGRDMLAARLFGVPDITGVEINPILVRLLTTEPGYADFSGLSRLPGMTFVVDEARSWFARTNELFDVIQMSLVDTWAATGAGAYTLSENGLYTVEAWKIFLDRLTPNGVFTVSRWYSPGDVTETGRLASLAMAVLLEKGVADPKQHIFMASSGNIATLILSPAPLAPDAVSLLKDVARDLRYTILAAPGQDPSSQVLTRLLSAPDRGALERYADSLTFDLTPPTDERPFFFNQLPLYNPAKMLAIAMSNMAAGIRTGNLLATYTLGILFLISAGLVLTTIVLPLRPAVKDVGRRLAVGGTAYFFLIGVGFMCVEIGLLQRMTVFLGHPVYSLSIVLFSLILATGLGSMISERRPLETRTQLIFWSVLTAGYLVSLPFWLPGLLLAFDSVSLGLRALLCVLVIAPAGLLMGYGFPTGMRLISAVDRTPTPWFWGINGAAGVLASIAAVVCSIGLGIGWTLAIGALCYALLSPAALVIGLPAVPATILKAA